jgi:glycosyltransferase involved in cell wall biosynthesis
MKLPPWASENVGAVRGEPADILAEVWAIVVDPGDAAARATAVLKLVEGPSRRNRVAQDGRRHGCTYFDRTARADRYLSLLTEPAKSTGVYQTRPSS